MTKSAEKLRTKKEKIRDVSLEDALGERYLAYALSTITSRSLPDARDGLKPVHRRLLYAMRQLKLAPKSGYKKSARVVGDVIGKFHPHGEQAVYDALVRLAQEFSSRYPLVNGQGNFGNIDGDGAAAARYTEAKLTDVAGILLSGIDEGTVDFQPTYDGEEDEPLVLPAAFPNLLANGANGIAVGMATSIPPHNVKEICDALLHLIKFPKATIDKLVDFIPGPDLPTGGNLIESRESIVNSYKVGRGSFRLRSNWNHEKLKRGVWQIVVTEIPFQVQKSKLIERIAELILSKKIPLLGDVRDESAEDVRLILEPKNKSIDPEILMETLFRATDLEVKIPLNMNVLDGGKLPQVVNLRVALQAFLNHRQEVVFRRTSFRLNKVNERLEILEGYILVFGYLDEVINIIRNKDNPSIVLQKRFKLNERQAESILDLRLRRLRRMDELSINEEHKNLISLRKELKIIHKSKEKRWELISKEVREIRSQFGHKSDIGARRTIISGVPQEINVPDLTMIEEEPLTVICSQKGWIRSIKGHVDESSDAKYKDGDSGRFWFFAKNTDRISIFDSNGKFYTLQADKIPSGRGMGEPIKLMADLANDSEIVSVRVFIAEEELLVASSDSRGLVIKGLHTLAHTRQGRQVLNLSDSSVAAVCTPVDGDTVAVIGENRKLLLFALDELPKMTRGRGVKLQRYQNGGLADVKVINKEDGLSWRVGGRTRSETDLFPWLGKRGQAGRLPPKGFPKSGKFN